MVGGASEPVSFTNPLRLPCTLLQLLPAEAERIELPRALQAVANLLRQRLQRVRDDARTVLVAMSIELGPPYVIYICK